LGLKYQDLIEIRLGKIVNAINNQNTLELDSALDLMGSALCIYPSIRKEYNQVIVKSKNMKTRFTYNIQNKYSFLDKEILEIYQNKRIDDYFKQLIESIYDLLINYKLISEV